MVVHLALSVLLAGEAQAGIGFCAAPDELTISARNCPDNRLLSRGAEDCYERVEALERKLGEEAMAIAKTGSRSQLSQTNTGNIEYGFSDEAFVKIINTAIAARNELREYHRYIMTPVEFFQPQITGGDPVAYSDATECQGGNERRIALVESHLLEKIERLKARRLEAAAHRRKLSGNATEFASVDSGAPARGVDHRRTPAVVKPTRGVASSSSITGVETDRAKRASSQPPKK